LNGFNLEDLIASILNQYYEESEIDNPVPLNITIVEDMTSAYEEVTGNQIVNDDLNERPNPPAMLGRME